MKIFVNNEPREMADGSSIADLLTEGHIAGSATALNGRFIPKDSRAASILQDGDEVTIISAAYGG